MHPVCAPSYHIGIDTGGTFTDGALVCRHQHRVLGTAKHPTTPEDLSLGIQACLKTLLHKSALPCKDIASVSVSTTLATNAVVENKGARVGLFVIGYDKRLHLPTADIRVVPGGHKAKGIEAEPLDLEILLKNVRSLRGQVDAYAVCAMLAFEDPTHELVAAKAIALLDKKPIFCSHQASPLPGFQERAATAVLNARLLPIMQKFLGSVQSSMQELGLHCPVRILRGDTESMDFQTTLQCAAATVASGPAATALFGAHLLRDTDAVLIDIGGTTTDITRIQNGRPIFSQEGMHIGVWKTHVQAVHMRTLALGGDSLVCATAHHLHIGPERVVPLCLVATRYPELSALMRAPATWIGADLHAQYIFPSGTAEAGQHPLVDHLLTYGPCTPEHLRTRLRLAEAELQQTLFHLAGQNQIIACGFTPTDALHVLGYTHFGDATQSREAADALAKICGQTGPEFSQAVLNSIRDRILTSVLSLLCPQSTAPELGHLLLQKRPELLTLTAQLQIPILGIGAAARYLLPDAAALLHTNVYFPEHHETGNALGAAYGPLCFAPQSTAPAD